MGRVRRTDNASREEAKATAEDLQTASLSLHTELAIDYFELRSADAYFPTLSIGATGGFERTTVTNRLNWPSRLWAVGPEHSETLFDAGRRRATSEAAQANYDGTVAAYRHTTLNASQKVEDNLAALRILETVGQQQQEATVLCRRLT